MDGKLHIFRFRHVPEGALHISIQVVQTQLTHIHGNRSGFNFRQVENVVDQHQQIVAGGVDRLGKVDLFIGEITFRIHTQLIRQDQQTIKRRA